MESSSIDTKREVINGLMNGKIHHSTPFHKLEYRPLTCGHIFGRVLGITSIILCQSSFVIGAMYCISKINMSLEGQKALMIGVGITLAVIFSLLDALSIFFGKVKEYHLSEEKKPNFINGFVDTIRQSMFLR